MRQSRLLRGLLVCALLSPMLSTAADDRERVDSRYWSTKYDRYFQKYSKRYFGPNFDWKWFKAQAIAESGLNPNALSNTGARGLMQILPSTYAEIRKKNPYFSHINEPRWNIAAGIYYDRFLYGYWPQIVEQQRLMYAGRGPADDGLRQLQRRTGWHAARLPSQRPAGPDLVSGRPICPLRDTQIRTPNSAAQGP